MSDTRLTDEQVADASEIMRGVLKLLRQTAWAAKPWHEISGSAKVALLAEQVSADLSAAKEENTRLLQRLPEVALYKLQKAAREAVVAGDRYLSALAWDGIADSRDVERALSALRSLLPEEGR